MIRCPCEGERLENMELCTVAGELQKVAGELQFWGTALFTRPTDFELNSKNTLEKMSPKSLPSRLKSAKNWQVKGIPVDAL